MTEPKPTAQYLPCVQTDPARAFYERLAHSVPDIETRAAYDAAMLAANVLYIAISEYEERLTAEMSDGE